MRVVGLDLSLTGTGVAATEGEQVFTSRVRGVTRLADLRNLIMICCDGAVLVVLEDYAFSRSGAHAHELGELGGVVRLGLWEACIPYACVLPNVLKSFATGKGNANKTDMALAAYKASGQEFSDDNKTDAWWLRQMGLYRVFGGPRALEHLQRDPALPVVATTAYRDNAVAKVAWPELAKAAS